ncbi:MAG TPA: hypothetical protein VNC84_05080 [Gammaproteobacteria bacterium]|jgi:hypothetical protein|nr:hypothetical protein [Gammaproteobacteria bacterium]
MNKPDPKKDEIHNLNKNKLDACDKHYVVYSDKLSSACRQLAFSEGAVFWIFSQTSYLSTPIAIGLLVLVLFFCVDMLQYYFGMFDYEYSASRIRKEMKRQEDEDDYKEIKEEDDPNKKLEKCFNWKLVFIGISSVLLIFVFFQIFFCH